MNGKLLAIGAGLAIALGAWVSLWIVTAQDPYANPFGLALLTIAASFAGGVIAAVGFIRLVMHAFRRAH
jgi:hypothetical protein